MADLEEPLRYCLYARKSSESEERQALSIDSQIKEMMQVATSEGLEITGTRRESHSAKDSGKRPVFKQLLEDIEAGIFNGILCWAPDRLSRNAGDLGELVDLIDRGYLKQIRTQSQTFTNNPNEKFLLMILCSQAKLENDNRGINIKRGLRAKCERGTRPGAVPLGYKLVRSPEFGEPSQIIIDEERAPFIKKMFQYVNNGLSGRQTNEYLTDEGFKTKKGKKIPLGLFYRMFKETFYYGEFEYPKGSGNWYKGNHKPLISKEEFEEANKRLEVPDKGVWGRKEFYFKNLFKCAHCGVGITAEEKMNRHGKMYTYYKCNQLGRTKCRSKYISEKKLVESIAKLVDQIQGEHLHLERKLKKEVERFNDLQRIATGQEESKTITTEEYLRYILKNGSKQEKRSILEYLGQLYLKDGEVVMHP